MKKIFILSLIISSAVSCTKEINVDLKNSTPQLVIEGNVNNSTGAVVSITQSVQFSNSNTFPTVSGAVVFITDNFGATFTLPETTPGNYTNENLVGVAGNTYNLSVTLDNKEYTATSVMPAQVYIDTLLFEQIIFGDETVWIVKPQYTDPAGFGDYYKFIEKINGVRFPGTWVWDDNFTNNGISTRPLIPRYSTINIGDTVEIEMQCIDKNIFRYITTLTEVQENSTTPANPDSNISGGVLGYFSAHTSQRKKAAVK